MRIQSKSPRRLIPALLAISALTLAACSPGSAPKAPTGSAPAGGTTVTFRLWDDQAKPAYEKSFAAFTAKNPGINVKVEVVPWGDYWTRLPLDLQSGDMADIFWTNSSNYAKFVKSGNLMDLTDVLGKDHDEWNKAATDLYLREGKLYGVPQLWDSIALYYNKDLVESKGVDVANLKWMPGAGEGDTLKAAAEKLTADKDGRSPTTAGFNKAAIAVYGFNAQMDLQAIYRDFLAQAGSDYQDKDDNFAFDNPKGVAAFKYLYDMVNTWHVAPSGADTNPNGDITRDLFIKGELALYQSGPYNLKRIAENTKVKWGIAPMVAGPEGRVSVVHSVAVVANAATTNKDAVAKVLKWLGSAEGQKPLAAEGVAFPAATAAQGAFVNYWKERGVDVQPFIDAAAGKTAPAPVGVNINAGINESHAVLQDLLIGTLPVEQAVKKAQEEGNKAMK